MATMTAIWGKGRTERGWATFNSVIADALQGMDARTRRPHRQHHAGNWMAHRNKAKTGSQCDPGCNLWRVARASAWLLLKFRLFIVYPRREWGANLLPVPHDEHP